MSRSNSSALKVLQTTTSGSNLVGGKQRSQRNIKGTDSDFPKKTGKLISIFSSKSDEKTGAKVSKKDACVGTDQIGQIDAMSNTEVSLSLDPSRPDSPTIMKEMLLGAKPNERYMELLAEERRKALDEALQENMLLAQEVARLREENRELRNVAEEGMRYADILKEALKEETDD